MEISPIKKNKKTDKIATLKPSFYRQAFDIALIPDM